MRRLRRQWRRAATQGKGATQIQAAPWQARRDCVSLVLYYAQAYKYIMHLTLVVDAILYFIQVGSIS